MESMILAMLFRTPTQSNRRPPKYDDPMGGLEQDVLFQRFTHTSTTLYNQNDTAGGTCE